MEPTEARRTTGNILLVVAAAGAVLLLLTLFVDFRACSGGGPAGCGSGVAPDLTNLMLGIVGAVVALAAGATGLLLRRAR